MHFLHLDSRAALAPVPPFGILEPPPEYGDGSPREDALEAAAPLDLVRLLNIELGCSNLGLEKQVLAWPRGAPRHWRRCGGGVLDVWAGRARRVGHA